MITYAPKRKTLKGTLKVAVINIEWTNKPSKGSENKVLTGLQNFVNRNSRNELKITGRAFKHKVPFPANRKNLNKAEKHCRDNNPSFDYYLIINNNVKSFSNAGGNTAHLKNSLTSTAIHEFMHLMSLEHSGKYIVKANKWTLLAYEDRQSVMGKYSSGILTPPQYWWLGWYTKEEVVDHEHKSSGMYTLDQVASLNNYNLKAIRIVIPGNQRPVFISRSSQNNLYRIHYGNRGGSQLIAEFKDSYTDLKVTGMNFLVSGDQLYISHPSVEHIEEEEINGDCTVDLFTNDVDSDVETLVS